MKRETVIIVGAGLAGLNCARILAENDVDFQLFEKATTVGGRVQTDHVDGYQLDRGFQVLLAAYPEARQAFDYSKLDLRPFFAGAAIQYRGRKHIVADPRRHPWEALRSLFGPIGTFSDKLRILRLQKQCSQRQFERAYLSAEKSSDEFLDSLGFTAAMRQRFLNPFLGGVHLDAKLETSARMTQFVFRMFSSGPTTLPLYGMGSLPQQLADSIPSDRIHLETGIETLDGLTVVPEGGQSIQAEHIVLATDLSTANTLLNLPSERRFRQSHTYYFSTDRSPMKTHCLLLNGDNQGPINHLCVPSDIASQYAPKGKSLVSISVLNHSQANLENEIREQLQNWIGKETSRWELVRVDHIRHALPSMKLSPESQDQGYIEPRQNVIVCGDHVTSSSINGALRSGRKAAHRILRSLSCNGSSTDFTS